MKSRVLFLLTLALLGGAMLLPAGCAPTVADGPGEIDFSQITLAPASALPDYVQDAAPRVQEAYRFALANPHVLEKIPCYCGCNAQGHMNNLDCYVVPNTGGEFEPHAAY